MVLFHGEGTSVGETTLCVAFFPARVKIVMAKAEALVQTLNVFRHTEKLGAPSRGGLCIFDWPSGILPSGVALPRRKSKQRTLEQLRRDVSASKGYAQGVSGTLGSLWTVKEELSPRRLAIRSLGIASA